MKRLSLLFVLLSMQIAFVFGNSFNSSRLKIRMWDNSTFTIVFDGSHFETPTNNFVATNLEQGLHQVKIMKHFSGSYYYGHHSVVLYQGFINIPANSKVIAKLNMYNQLNIERVETISYAGYNNYGSNNNDYYESSYDNNYYNNQNYFSSNDFMQLQSSISNVSFESSKLQIAKQAVGMNKVSSNQVAQIMQLFSFESTKLEFAKYAYNHVYDKSNYYVVNNAFSFSSSISELNQFLYGTF
ncbi:MAG TPA: hypothetical protein DDX39_07135 [Bacteroidales bacterium]|nr:MAG: hypothetical protein A2W98_12140 [Bacteroidetes bacterium GWF2_33_38]OFY75444.1 MAG: hypothetical protein A2265_11485 [Bacteroidetes bacterium RIFOXYA12_FULL_33_9]OFY91888.1 MAG: hypothetical protein A2236_06035 [Bacteroidetes bacterium RIFOXYA2_FULL_33_7]HBF88403.1 hypothetical protein [Bacteroidales bacterium]